MDPFKAIADIILGWHKAGQLQGWLRLIFGMTSSYLITFNVVAGSVLGTTQSWPMGIGAGMVAGGAFAFVAYRHADKDLVKGITVAVPQKTVEASFDEKTGQGPLVVKPPK